MKTMTTQNLFSSPIHKHKPKTNAQVLRSNGGSRLFSSDLRRLMSTIKKRSSEKAENLFEELSQNRPSGDIGVPQFSTRITELGLPEEYYEIVTLENPAIHNIESTPRYFRSSLKGAKVALNAVVSGDDLDSGGYTRRLDETSNQISSRGPSTNDQSLVAQISIGQDKGIERERILYSSREKNSTMVKSPFPSEASQRPTRKHRAQAYSVKKAKPTDIASHVGSIKAFKAQNPTLPVYLINQAVQHIVKSILRGKRIIRLHLKLPELGVLKVEMIFKDNILKLRMFTENTSAKELLLSNIHKLKERLVQQGIKLERVDIQTYIEDPLTFRESDIKGIHIIDLIA